VCMCIGRQARGERRVQEVARGGHVAHCRKRPCLSEHCPFCMYMCVAVLSCRQGQV